MTCCKQPPHSNSIVAEQLAIARQELLEEERLLGRDAEKESTIGGIPVDSEYIIFIIDTGLYVLLCPATHVRRDGGHTQHLPQR